VGTVTDISTNAQLLSAIVEEVTPQLFEAYGASVQHVEGGPRPNLANLPDLCGVLGFVGDHLQGTVTLASSTAVLQEVMKSVPGVDSATDWLAELTNQLLGRIKSRLLRYGAPVMSSTPVVVSGQELRVEMGDHHVNCFHTFSGSAGLLHVWLGAEIAEGVVLRENEGVESPPNEGDLLLF
jgi:CheY-specific phosphatase CheX